LCITLINKIYDIIDIRGGALWEEYVCFNKEYITK
jgi:hypothetical protein